MDFNKYLAELDINLNENQLKQFEDYYSLLVSYNEKVNLTAITEHDEVYIKHFYDSLIVSKSVDFNNVKTICDVGSGAGFPSIPLKILYPHLKVTIVDPLNKRLIFLQELVNTLKLKDVELVHERAEDYRKIRDSYFDVVTQRAVARQSIVNELCLPLTKIGGLFISLKGSNYKEELAEGKSLQILNSSLEKVDEYKLPLNEDFRSVITIKRNGDIPKKYPRRFDIIKKNPL